MSWQIYTQYDEDSLTMHSNAGLLRRARKALAEVELLSQSTTELLFKVEECEVKLPSEGITKASCNCSAQGSCKHILSSILWIQDNTAVFSESVKQTENIEQTTTQHKPEDQNSNISAPQVIENTKNALDVVLEFDHLKIQKKAGKANVRLAYELVQNWQTNQTLCTVDIQAEKISFQTDLSPNKVLLYPTTGFEGMLSDIPDKQKIAGHLACIAYLWLKHRPETWQWAIDTTQHEQRSEHQLSSDDFEFIEELKVICQNFIQQGLSHLAKESVMALHIYNMQARAQSLPRLGSVLRTLHGTMKQFLENNVQVEEQQIFNQIAYLYAYLVALSEVQRLAPELQTKALTKLRGSVQRDYQQETVEHLIPLGCEWWSTESGAHGLTVCFWDSQQNQLKEVTQARANHLDRTFDMHSAAATGIWGSSLSYVLQHQLELIDAKASSETSFSATSETRFIQKGLVSDLKKADLDQLNIGVSKWHDLQTLITPHSSLEPPKSRYVLLRHKSISAPDLNEFEQSFEYRVVDEQGIAVKLSLPIEPEYRARIKHLTQLIQNDQIVASLVRIDTTTKAIQLIPCSVFLDTAKGLKIFSLDYDYPIQKKSSLAELITGRFEKLLAEKKQWKNHQNYSAIDVLVIEIQTLLEFYANTGRAVLDQVDLDKIQNIAQQFSDLGLDFVAHSLRFNLTQNNLAIHLLKWRHVLLQLQRLNQRIILEGQTMS
ncbi:hypothetical protein [Acinetobacter rongchengensis]|uniref:SWIM-type domain-containing protein n=1 Tax=Acinetobacter rongchengensis TaxID=2419601 RepID=A0A3A8F7Q1_9GAMM|nr:hypothetical protein [Acinetobacter rongchengensis]RKG37181.1 hypothetical protein D7V20_11970 [Acinetobacter rongchengensis]